MKLSTSWVAIAIFLSACSVDLAYQAKSYEQIHAIAENFGDFETNRQALQGPHYPTGVRLAAEVVGVPQNLHAMTGTIIYKGEEIQAAMIVDENWYENVPGYEKTVMVYVKCFTEAMPLSIPWWVQKHIYDWNWRRFEKFC